MRAPAVARRELLVLLAILALAALLRLPGLDQRGRWDADQGTDMLVLRALVTRGDVPLLGPRTSIGTFHHGAAYYYLLAPAAAVSAADPVAVTVEIALIGIGAVAAAWWLARLVGGPLAALAAALLAAVSPAAIDESTFIWNPNLIPLAAALAYGGAIRAWETRRPRWWLLAAAGTAVTMQLHVLGIVILPPLVLAFVADLRRRSRVDPGASTRPLVLAGLGAVAVIAAGYVPLVIHELGHDFAETRAILDYVAGGGRTSAADAGARIATVGLRSVAWPLAGLVSDRPAAAILAAVAAVATMLAGAFVRRAGGPGDGDGLGSARWLLGTLGWAVAALAIVAPSLATVIPGLPNDHYHAFLDPLVLVLVGVGLARLAEGARRVAGAGAPVPLGPPGRLPAPRLVAAAGLIGFVGLAVVSWPPATSEDGGWRLADDTAARVVAGVVAAGRSPGTSPGDGSALAGIPPFKSANALRFPLERRGLDLGEGPASSDLGLVVVCDPLFAEVVGAPCGGAAEDELTAGVRPPLDLTDRFVAGPRRVVSIYAPAIR